MKNLIMADLKVLGKRIWLIPLGFVAGCFVLSIFKGINDKDFTTLAYFINLYIVPVIMLIELLREEQKNRTEMMILTMPVSKTVFVYSRFLMAILFMLLGIILLSLILLSKNITSENLVPHFFKDPKALLYYFSLYGFIMYLTVSLYYYTGRVYLAVLTSTAGLFSLIFLNIWVQESFLLPNNVCWSDDFYLYLYPLRLVYIFGSMIILQFILQRIFKNISPRSVHNAWFFIISIILFNYIIGLPHDIFYEYSVVSNVQNQILLNDGTFTPEQILKWNINIDVFYVHLTMILASTVILLIAWVISFIKNKDTVMKSYILIGLVPFAALSFTYTIYMVIETFLKIDVKYGEDTFYISTISEILFIPLSLFSFAKLTTFILNSKKTC
jgi:hypothetical protein